LNYGSDGISFPTLRTPQQTEVGLFWSDPPAVQSQRALRLHADRDPHLDATETAQLFALANTAGADSLIACADAKYAYDFWRPIGAIRGIPADDGDPATAVDTDWTPLAGTPNFPEYPSNHGCFTTAVATVVDRLDGGRPFRFEMTSTVTGTTVVFKSREDMIRHVANGRVWGGLHWRFSVEAGTEIGRAVAAKVLRTEG
jgi:hypothetical protein